MMIDLRNLMTLLVGVALAAPLSAQQELTLPATTDVTIPRLVVVPAEAPAWAALSDTHRLLVVAQSPGTSPPLLLIRLDEQGQPLSPPLAVTLSRPEKLSSRWQNDPLSVAFHPTLPLLYVWQDLSASVKSLARDPASSDFDHLAIYDLEGDEPELLVSLCRGEGFALEQSAGSLVIDAAGERLYLPNLRHPSAKPPALAAVGTLDLGSDGLPTDDPRRSERMPNDRAKARQLILARAAALKGSLKKARAEGKSVSVRSVSPNDNSPFVAFPAGVGFIPINEQVTIVGGPFGPVTWDEGNRRARFHSLYLQVFAYTSTNHRMVGHPSLPVVYGSRLHSGIVYRVEHADGYITGLPQLVTGTATDVLTAPVVLTKRKQLALGGAGRIIMLNLDDEGAIRPEQGQALVECTSGVNALAYSEAGDRLYAAVRLAPLEKKK